MATNDSTYSDEKGDTKNDPESPVLTGEELAEKALPAIAPPEPELDGGSRAWLQVLGSFIVFSNLWGMTFAFGSFQSYYTLTYLAGTSASTIAWIGTIQVCLLILEALYPDLSSIWGISRLCYSLVQPLRLWESS